MKRGLSFVVANMLLLAGGAVWAQDQSLLAPAGEGATGKSWT